MTADEAVTVVTSGNSMVQKWESRSVWPWCVYMIFVSYWVIMCV